MVKKTKVSRVVAVLNDQNVLIGSTVVDDDSGVEFGDLPTNGSYKYDPKLKTFIPLGHGFGKVKTRQPYENDLVVATLIEALAKVPGFEVPHVASEWLNWYNTELRRRDEEKAARPR